VGLIVAKGENVTEWNEGDRVAALIQTGGNALYAVIKQTDLVAVPRSLDSAEAVCMVSTYMTAYQALKLVIGKERTLEGKTILVTGAIGPTGQALIQMAKRAGANKVYATAPAKLHRYVKSVLGAKALPMEPEEWLPEVKGKMDIVLDGACQDGFDSPQKALSPNGTLVCVGMAALMNSESMGAFGAPMSARWTQTKASYFMSNTKYYNIWSSYANNQKGYKVR
jgi:NADPH:quinone reductase-like Zn-dependent oxidoreductase